MPKTLSNFKAVSGVIGAVPLTILEIVFGVIPNLSAKSLCG